MIRLSFNPSKSLFEIFTIFGKTSKFSCDLSENFKIFTRPLGRLQNFHATSRKTSKFSRDLSEDFKIFTRPLGRLQNLPCDPSEDVDILSFNFWKLISFTDIAGSCFGRGWFHICNLSVQVS